MQIYSSEVSVVQEHGAQVITTTPTVPYIFEYADGRWAMKQLVPTYLCGCF
jgi:hypothetical protein